MLRLLGAMAIMGIAASFAFVARASVTSPIRPGVNLSAARAAGFEEKLSQLDPALSDMANQLKGRLAKGRSGVAERSITWTARNGAVMTTRIWLTEVQGKTTMHTSLEASSNVIEGMNQSFNLQYLDLQQQMQDENRRFSLVSNIMKNKHDTSKNSISNLR
jgi:hypothetical protein